MKVSTVSLETSAQKHPLGKPAIFITGSGKCGTSVVAHCFFASGFPMGTLEDLHIFEGRGNLRGLWEHKRTLDLNCEILEFNSCDWHTPSQEALKVSEEMRERLRLFAESVPAWFCCKDPRFVSTFSAWYGLFDPIAIVGCFRHPAGFIKSLVNVWPDKYSTGSRHDRTKAFELWNLYSTRLLSLAEQVPVHWIDFDESLPNLKFRIASVISRFGRIFNEQAFDQFYIPTERRFSHEAESGMSGLDVPKHVLEVYDRLIEAYRISSAGA